MGNAELHRSVLRFAAIFSRHESALVWARETLAEQWGTLALESEVWDFTQTGFYQRQMGDDLKKQLLAFELLVDPAELPDWKLQTNGWEDKFRDQTDHPEPRPLNLDPGYVTEAKLVLASTKDRDHRIYLGKGIFAEGTLYYHAGQWSCRPWTYPDYQTDHYHRFLDQCRVYLRQRYRNTQEF